MRDVIVQLSRGAHKLWQARPAWWSVWGVLAHRTAYGVALLLLIVASRSVLSPDSDSEALGVFALAIGAAGVGALLGAVITPPIVRATSPARWSAAIVLCAALLVTAGLLTVTIAGFLVVGFFLGLAGQSIKIDTDTVVALNIPDDSRGRVFSLLDVGINVALLTGIAIAGLGIGDKATSVTLTVLTGLLLVASFLAFITSGRSQRS